MDIELKILSRLNLCEMLLSELKSKDKQDISIDEENEIINVKTLLTIAASGL